MTSKSAEQYLQCKYYTTIKLVDTDIRYLTNQEKKSLSEIHWNKYFWLSYWFFSKNEPFISQEEMYDKNYKL